MSEMYYFVGLNSKMVIPVWVYLQRKVYL
eukprot:UN05041